jgi:hypothetical protein
MPETSLLYTAVYNDVGAALADLDAFEQLHKAEMIGKCDAAVVDKEEGKPHIVRRVDHPGIRIIPEFFGAGPLPRKELKEAAEDLTAGEAGLIAIGEPTLEKGFEEAITRSNKIVKHELHAAAEEVADELGEAFKK